MIKNSSLLKQNSTYLKGTGTIPGLEAAYIDTYLKAGLTEGTDFVLFTQHMWNHAKKIYGFDHEIKRVFTKKNRKGPLTEVVVNLKEVPVFISTLTELHTV